MKKGIKAKDRQCIKCNKIGVLAKELCTACYSKHQRNTPKGKIALQLYRQTKGKLATQRYLNKKRPKPPKEIKLCECGNKTVAKGLCRNCYQKEYAKKYTIKKWITDYSETYKKVLDQVMLGNTISKACDLVKIQRNTFYKNITPIQKKEINSYKSIRRISKIDYYDDFI
jgi:DNA-binding protein